MPEINENDVWLHVYRLGEVSYTNLIKTFVESGKCSKPTLLAYKKKLEKEGKIKKKLNEKTGRPVYYVPEEWRDKVERLRNEKRFFSILNVLEKLDEIDPIFQLISRFSFTILSALATFGFYFNTFKKSGEKLNEEEREILMLFKSFSDDFFETFSPFVANEELKVKIKELEKKEVEFSEKFEKFVEGVNKKIEEKYGLPIHEIMEIIRENVEKGCIDASEMKKNIESKMAQKK